MTQRNLGGALDMRAMALLHQPPHTRALSDAVDYLRRCLSALAATDLPRTHDAAQLGNVRAVLIDQLAAIDRLQAGTL